MVANPARIVVWSTGGVGSFAIDAIRHKPDLELVGVWSGEVINISPLCGGLPPELAWPYLKRVGEIVMSEVVK